jgi:hypothetical protein
MIKVVPQLDWPPGKCPICGAKTDFHTKRVRTERGLLICSKQWFARLNLRATPFTGYK